MRSIQRAKGLGAAAGVSAGVSGWAEPAWAEASAGGWGEATDRSGLRPRLGIRPDRCLRAEAIP
jgi:hypothetical protein